jgi:hypothetical protein
MARHAVQLSCRSVLDLRLRIADCRFEFGSRDEGEQAQTMPDEGLKRKADFCRFASFWNTKSTFAALRSKPWKIRTL